MYSFKIPCNLSLNMSYTFFYCTVHVPTVHVCFQHNFCGNFFQLLDRPADCSNTSVVPECCATTNTMGDTDFSVTLPSSTSLSCVEGYLIRFNGESKFVSLSSPSATFTINEGEGQSLQNEIVVYTLDYENRTGLVPCTYSIPGEFLQMHMILRFAKK